MKLFLATALLMTAVAGMPDGAGWDNKAPAPHAHAHPQPSNVQYGPWVSQPTQYRQEKTFASIMPTGLGGLRNLANFWTWDKQTVFDVSLFFKFKKKKVYLIEYCYCYKSCFRFN